MAEENPQNKQEQKPEEKLEEKIKEEKQPVSAEEDKKTKKSKKSEEKPQITREFTIPLRKSWLKVSRHERARIAVREIKRFLVRHMKIRDRDLKKIKLDTHLNNELWFRGSKKPPAKIKVGVIKEGDSVKVDFLSIPEKIKFHKTRLEKRFKKVETKKPEEKPVEKTEEEKAEEEKEKKQEKEKAKATAEVREKQAEKQAKAEKHTQKGKAPQIHRQALKK
jgi:large subunit ribosomal protein L31e